MAGDVLLVNGQPSEHQFAEHVSQWQAPFNGNKLDLGKVITKLGELQLNNVWVEAGAKLAGALLENKLIDELIFYQAPKLIGGAGQNLFDIMSIEDMHKVMAKTSFITQCEKNLVVTLPLLLRIKDKKIVLERYQLNHGLC